MDSIEVMKKIVDALEEKKGRDILVLDISGVSTLGDYFVIASGDNAHQLCAMADNVEEQLGKEGVSPKSIEGYQGARWILMDYQDVIVHIFDKEDRRFYDIERIWRDGKQIEVK